MVLLEAMQCGCNILITQKLYLELFYSSGTAHKFIHTFDGSVEDLQDKLRILGEKNIFIDVQRLILWRNATQSIKSPQKY